MSKRKTKTITTIVLALVSMTMAIWTILSRNTYAVEVVGEQYGLRVKVSDDFVPTDNLYPGDTEVSTMTVSVVEVDKVEASSLPVWIRWEITDRKLGMGGGDLDDKLEFLLYHDDGTLLYNGAFSGLTAPISLGNIAKGDSKKLTFKVHLPGESTGNEYMSASLSVKWTVIAQYQPEITPSPTPTGTPSPSPTPADTPTPTPTPPDTHEPTPGTSPTPYASPTPDTTPPVRSSPTPDTTPISTPDPTPGTTPTPEPDMTPVPTVTPETIIELEDELIPGVLPRTGELPPILFYSLGAMLILVGIFIGKNRINT